MIALPHVYAQNVRRRLKTLVDSPSKQSLAGTVGNRLDVLRTEDHDVPTRVIVLNLRAHRVHGAAPAPVHAARCGSSWRSWNVL